MGKPETPPMFGAKGRHPRSAETSLVDALKIARRDELLGPLDLAAVGLARQSARAVDDALRSEERADNVATLVRAHLAVLRDLGLTPASRAERSSSIDDGLVELLSGLDVPS